MPVTPGQRLGPYDVVALLGAGGMGTVYRAFDRRLQRDVALKVLQTDDPQHRQRFEREALAVAALNHPNIVTIHSVEEVDGVPFLTMELVDGEPLSRRIPPGGFALRDLLGIGLAIADALGAAHERGIVHRDLKPANVMLSKDGRVKMLDFGLAKTTSAVAVTAEQTREGIIVGTLAYMSPEQVSGEPVDARTDVFSLGVMLFEMATGRRPFEGATETATIMALLTKPVPPSGYPELDRVIARATARRPELRYQRVLEVAADLRAVASGEAPKPAPPARAASVAVLPFSNMSADADQEYFCDGMAEELISALSRVKGLAVAARTSTFQFKGQRLDVREIGARLGVESVLEGSVRKLGNRLRITAQLINVHDGYQMWSDRYDRTADDVFAIQDEIAHAITESLKVRLTRSRETRIVKQPTENLEAYYLYLRGRFLLNRLTDLQEALPAARACFEQAVTLDPHYAAAYAGLSEACNALGYTTLLPAAEASGAAFAAARKAIELDPDLPEAHTALGWTKTLFAIDIGTAEDNFKRALDLAPHASAHAYYALLLACFGRFDEALAHVESARQRDPLWLLAPFFASQVLISARRFDAAERQMREVLALDARIDGVYWFLSSALAGQGRFAEAIEILEKGVEMVRRAPFFIALLGVWYGRAGRRTDAEAIYQELIDGGRSSPIQLALVSAAVGDMDRAFSYLDRALDEHNDQVSLMAFDHRFDAFRGDARFEARLRRVGLPVHAI